MSKITPSLWPISLYKESCCLPNKSVSFYGHLQTIFSLFKYWLSWCCSNFLLFQLFKTMIFHFQEEKMAVTKTRYFFHKKNKNMHDFIPATELMMFSRTCCNEGTGRVTFWPLPSCHRPARWRPAGTSSRGGRTLPAGPHGPAETQTKPQDMLPRCGQQLSKKKRISDFVYCNRRSDAALYCASFVRRCWISYVKCSIALSF